MLNYIRLWVCAGLSLLLAAAPSQGQVSGFHWDLDTDWLAPSDYYATTVGLTGTALRDAVHEVIEKDYFSHAADFSSGANIALHTQHRVNSYADAGPALDALDQAMPRVGLFDTPMINHIYDNENRLLTDPEGRNREHVYSSSRQQNSTTRGADTESDYADLYNLRWADATTNGQKLARNFDDGTVISPAESAQDGAGIVSDGHWYPGEDHRGDVARQIFYMDVRYDGDTSQDPDTTDLEAVYGHPSNFSTNDQGDLDAMLDWHYADPIDPWELRRNHIIFNRSYKNEFGGTETPNNWITQGNRNFAVDRPEYVHAILVDNANDTQINVGGTPASDGSSSVDVVLGRVFLNQLAGSLGSASVTINKAGNDGTYYEIAASGGATAEDGGEDATGRYNAFEVGGSGSRSIDVGLGGAVDTSSTGLQGGTVTINNLDVTTGGGAGKGANDADDLINVGVQVVDARIISASSVNVGTYITGGSGNGTTTFFTSGDDNHFTRTRVNDGNYSSTNSTVDADNNLFNSDGETDTASVATSISTVGNQTDSVTLSTGNGGVTGEGLAGETVNDIVVHIDATVLAHSNASFDGNSNADTHAIDFGLVRQGSGIQQQGFAVYNIESVAGFTAALDGDAVNSTGDASGTLSSDLGTFSNLAAGGVNSYNAFVNPINVGSYALAQTLTNSDEDLSGAIAGTNLVLTITADVSLLGDVDTDGDQTADDIDADDIDALFTDYGTSNVFADLDDSGTVDSNDTDKLVRDILGTEYGDVNLDGEVDADDFNLLAFNFDNPGGWANGDFDGDGTVEADDFNLLAFYFGFNANVSPNDILIVQEYARSIPEPAALAMFSFLVIFMAKRKTRRSSTTN